MGPNGEVQAGPVLRIEGFQTPTSERECDRYPAQVVRDDIADHLHNSPNEAVITELYALYRRTKRAGGIRAVYLACPIPSWRCKAGWCDQAVSRSACTCPPVIRAISCALAGVCRNLVLN